MYVHMYVAYQVCVYQDMYMCTQVCVYVYKWNNPSNSVYVCVHVCVCVCNRIQCCISCVALTSAG